MSACATSRRARRLSNEERYYWRLWADIFRAHPVADCAARDSLRHDVAANALGYGKPRKEWTHREYDLVLDAMRALRREGRIVSTPSSRAVAEMEGARRRAVFNIRAVGIPDAYLNAIARNKFAWTADWSELGLPQLGQLLITAKARAKKRAENPKQEVMTYDSDDIDRPF